MPPNIITNNSSKRLSFNAVHFTDMHLTDNVICNSRILVFKNRLLSHNIQLGLNTGDSIEPTGKNIWDNLKSSIDLKFPLLTARGNHDYTYTASELGMPNEYYFYDKNEWRFIILNSIGVANYSLDAPQLAWLTNLLNTTPQNKYICVMSHVPILGIAPMMWYMRNNQAWNTTLDYHVDAIQLINLFKNYPNIKLCLSGHEHTIDEVINENITYLCSGAVSGNWWADLTYTESGYMAGYRLIDFYSDGTFNNKFIKY